jgi:hypothetical protein
MRAWYSYCSALMAGVLAAAPAWAQAGAPVSWSASPAAQLKASLRSLAAAQSRYRKERGTYAASLLALQLRSEPGVSLEVTAASATGWQGRAVQQFLPGRSCVIFVGSVQGREPPRTAADGEMAGEDGVPLCDRMR